MTVAERAAVVSDVFVVGLLRVLVIVGLWVGLSLVLTSCSSLPAPVEEGKVRIETRHCAMTVVKQLAPRTWSVVQSCGEADVVDVSPTAGFAQPVPEDVPQEEDE